MKTSQEVGRLFQKATLNVFFCLFVCFLRVRLLFCRQIQDLVRGKHIAFPLYDAVCME